MKQLQSRGERYNYFLNNKKKYNDFMGIIVGSVKENGNILKRI